MVYLYTVINSDLYIDSFEGLPFNDLFCMHYQIYAPYTIPEHVSISVTCYLLSLSRRARAVGRRDTSTTKQACGDGVCRKIVNIWYMRRVVA